MVDEPEPLPEEPAALERYRLEPVEPVQWEREPEEPESRVR